MAQVAPTKPPLNIIVADTETNGFLEEVSKLHSLVLRSDKGHPRVPAGELIASARGAVISEVEAAKQEIDAADLIVGHNFIGYDQPVLSKLGIADIPQGKIRDTIVMARLVYPDLKNTDWEEINSGRLEMAGNLAGSHSLKAWGYRLGILKGAYGETNDWSTWTPEMQEYCEQDTAVGLRLWQHLVSKGPDPRAVELEHQVAWIIAAQERRGVWFDVEEAQRLYAEMVGKRATIEAEAAAEGGWWWAPDMKKDERFRTVPKTTRRTCKVTGLKVLWAEGAQYTKLKKVYFSPSSRQHVARLLMRRYGWKPTAFTSGGEPELSEDVLSSLKFPIAQKLAEFYMLEKRIGAIAEGSQAWLKLVKNGRIHGRVVTNGTPTGRAIHSNPNLGQVPSISNAKGTVPYGKECRALFRAAPGLTLVGADCSGLELRCLAHYLSRWDDGAYIQVVISGDVHWTNAKAFFGLPPDLEMDPENMDHKFYRGAAKRIIYALMYGAGPELLGDIVEPKAKKAKKKKIGLDLIENFMKALPAFKQLKKALKSAVEKNGYLIGLDGRHIPVRSEHSALNFLLQSAGAIICKRWMVETRNLLTARGIIDQEHYWQVLWVHDEVQIECLPEHAKAIGEACVEATQIAGDYFGFKCPLTGEAKIGQSWADCH